MKDKEIGKIYEISFFYERTYIGIYFCWILMNGKKSSLRVLLLNKIQPDKEDIEFAIKCFNYGKEDYSKEPKLPEIEDFKRILEEMERKIIQG